MLEFLSSFMGRSRVIHLDYASTTPVRPEVFDVMRPYFTQEWANPSAIYKSGVRARNAIHQTRTQIARTLRIRAEGVLFTSGGTESNNHALSGSVEALHASGRPYEEIEIITTKIEHPSIVETCAALKKRGVVVVFLDLDVFGCIQTESLERLLNERTALVTFAYVNSEIGVVQDVKRITRIVRAHNTKRNTETLIHLDAAQAPLWLPCEMDMLGVDMLTLDAGKCYGPKGVGVLALRHGVSIAPFMYGGGQEGGMRSGTENTPLIVGCGEALVRAQADWKSRSEAVASLRDFMITTLLTRIPGAVLNGSQRDRVANNVNVSILGIDSEFAVITLDCYDIAIGTKSACGTSDSTGSHVVRTLTQDDARATSTLRFTLGESTTKKELEKAIRVLEKHVKTMLDFNRTLKKMED